VVSSSIVDRVLHKYCASVVDCLTKYFIAGGYLSHIHTLKTLHKGTIQLLYCTNVLGLKNILLQECSNVLGINNVLFQLLGLNNVLLQRTRSKQGNVPMYWA
jgi:hypothetical protein